MKVCMILAPGFEEIEAVAVIDIIRRAGIHIVTISTTDEKLVKGCNGISIQACCLLTNIMKQSDKTYDCLILPGGPAHKLLIENEMVSKLTTEHHDKNKIIAVICASPLVIQAYGLFKKHKITCYPYLANEISSDYIYNDDPVQQDGNYITGRSPSDAIEFGLKILSAIVSQDLVKSVRGQLAII
ncbi:Intracellular protease 1 [Intoshia linei]|uniref:Intracellular protease 1 n=1 Tax=Intoshia linei TaxID=1819745 RepID=A0A177AXI8_9BILA|nr:Intracellular protease 1 [Intoshia linei]